MNGKIKQSTIRYKKLRENIRNGVIDSKIIEKLTTHMHKGCCAWTCTFRLTYTHARTKHTCKKMISTIINNVPTVNHVNSGSIAFIIELHKKENNNNNKF